MMRATITHCGDAYELPRRLQRLFGGTAVHFCGASDAICGLHQVEVEIDEADRDWRSLHRRNGLFEAISEEEDVASIHFVEC